MNTYEQARQKYLPDKVRVLFIAEAPPEDVERFFYYEEVKSHDALFVNLLRALYEDCRVADISMIRENKKKLLERFKNDGYYLIDALPEPISLKLKPHEREKLIRARSEDISKQIKELRPEVGTILIKATVFAGLFDHFTKKRLTVINKSLIPFPGLGQQGRFLESMLSVLK